MKGGIILFYLVSSTLTSAVFEIKAFWITLIERVHILIGELMKYAKTEVYFRVVPLFFQNQNFTVGATLKNKE